MTEQQRNRGVALRAAAFAAALLVCAPVSAQSSGCDNLRELPINFNVQWQTQVKPIFNELLGGRCTSCHNSGGSAGGLNLSDDPVDAIYNVIFVVTPGNVPNSLLFDKVNCDSPTIGNRMPFGSTPLTIAEQALIYDWIEQGALGDPEKDPPIFRDHIFRDGAESLRLY